MSDTPSDAALVAAVRAGSDAAFARLVDRHQQALRLFLRRVCGHEADADDVAQESFVAAWTHLASLRTPEHFRSWLFGLAWRKAKQGQRSAVRRRQRDEAWQDMRETAQAPRSDMGIALQQALATLPEDQRASIALCLAGGWTHAEAAEALDLPLGTVKSHVTRGRSRLEAALGVGDE